MKRRLLAALIAGSLLVVCLGGSARAATSLSPGSFDFGSHTVGQSSPIHVFNFGVSGQNCLVLPDLPPLCAPISSPAVPGVTGPFTFVNGCPPTLFAALGGGFNSCPVSVRFVPTSPGPAESFLSIGGQTALLRGTGLAGPGGPGGPGGGVQQAGQASNSFSFGGVKLNEGKGTATLTVDVPGAGSVTLGGNGVVKQRPATTASASKITAKAATVKLKVKAKGRKKGKLNETGKVKVKAKITFTPTGGISASKTKKITLKKSL